MKKCTSLFGDRGCKVFGLGLARIPTGFDVKGMWAFLNDLKVNCHIWAHRTVQ